MAVLSRPFYSGSKSILQPELEVILVSRQTLFLLGNHT